MLKIIFSICIYLCICINAQTSFSSKPEILIHPIEASTEFPAFNRFIEEQGVIILQQELLKKFPYINVKTNGDARYFGIGRVSSYSYSFVESQGTIPQKAFLAKVLFTLFVYDVQEQQTVLKQDFGGYKAVPYSNNDSQVSLNLLKKAFQDSVAEAAAYVDIPLTGKIIAVNSESITVDIGTFHSVSANNKLDVVNSKGKSIGFAEVLSSELKREQCRAYFPAGLSKAIVGDVVRLVTVVPNNEKVEKELEQEVVDDALRTRGISFTKLTISPNPPLKLEVIMPTTSDIIYADKRSRYLPLNVYGFDAWEDQIVVKDNILWKSNDWEINPTAQNNFLLTINKYGHIKIYAIYNDSVANTSVKSPPVSVEVRYLENIVFDKPYILMMPGEEQKLNISALYNDNKILSLEEVNSELVWEYSNEKLQINNGNIRAGDVVGDAELKVYSKSLPQIAAYIHILILPSLQLEIVKFPTQMLPNNSIMFLGYEEKVRLEWIVKGIPDSCKKYIEVKWDIQPLNWGKITHDGNTLFFIAGTETTTTPIKVVANIEHIATISKRKDTQASIWIEIYKPIFTIQFVAITSACSFLGIILLVFFYKIIQMRKPFPIPRKFNSCYLTLKDNKQERYICLLAKKSIILGRSSNCDVQIYHTNPQGKPNKDLTNFISRKHCQIILENNDIWLEKIAQTDKHNATIVNENNKIENEAKCRLQDNDIFKIGRLNLKINIWRDNKNKSIKCIRLQYLNNPYRKEEYIVIYSSAAYGSGINVPIRVRENIPDIAGEFISQQNHIFIQKNVQRKWLSEQPRPLVSNTSFMMGKSKVSIHSEED